MSIINELRFIGTFLMNTMRKSIDRCSNIEGDQVNNQNAYNSEVKQFNKIFK